MSSSIFFSTIGEMMKYFILNMCIACIMVSGAFTGCIDQKSREESIPDDAIKYTPDMDVYPPIVHDENWTDPVPMSGPINTAGGEDAGFITPDGTDFFFFFTPDVTVPENEQVTDGVTGIWWSQKSGNSWTEPTRVILSETLALDGAPFYQNNTLWFASFRAGNYKEDGDIWTATYENGDWTDIENAGKTLNEDYNVGEIHLTSDGETMYFHRESYPGSGEYDLFTLSKTDDTWSEPVRIDDPISTDMSDSRPFVTADEHELWFTRPSTKGYVGPAVFRSEKNENGSWGEPVEVVSNFAAEPTLDAEGNLYFVHHFFDEEMNMIEADMYVAYRK